MKVEAIKRQFELSWDMLDEAISRCPDAVWRAETPAPYSIGRLAFHTLQSTQRYCRTGHKRVELDPFKFGGQELHVPMSKFPGAEEVRGYSGKVRRRVLKWLDSLEDRQLSDSDSAFLWTGRTIGERLCYTLKHFNHHLGQINLILRQNGIEAAEWKCVR